MQASAGSYLYTGQSDLDFGPVEPVASETSPAGEPDDLPFDWADPDRFADEIETALWYDVDCDPYSRGGLDVDFSDDDLDRSDLPPAPVEFYLGTHRPHWAHPGKREAKPAGPLFVSARQLRCRRRSEYPVFDVPVSVDSGGFTELGQHGRWTIEPEQYAAEIVALAESSGIRWAAIQDWMCEPAMLAKTGLTVAEHQARSVASFLRLRALAPSIRWLPVLQGQTVADYLAHVELYKAAGVELRSLALVGVGSVCRRQSSGEIVELLAALAGLGLRLHGFGVKSRGLALAGEFLASADSLAWSLAARREGNDPNSLSVAEAWRAKILNQLPSRK
jgi:hypothetical protein